MCEFFCNISLLQNSSEYAASKYTVAQTHAFVLSNYCAHTAYWRETKAWPDTDQSCLHSTRCCQRNIREASPNNSALSRICVVISLQKRFPSTTVQTYFRLLKVPQAYQQLREGSSRGAVSVNPSTFLSISARLPPLCLSLPGLLFLTVSALFLLTPYILGPITVVQLGD